MFLAKSNSLKTRRLPARAAMAMAMAMALTLLLISAGAASAQPEEIVPGVFRLSGVEETLPHGELEPLGRMLRRADVVGLGEAIHATRGFSRAKFRLFKYLVEEEGFRAFGIESPWIAAEAAGRFVATCQGAPEEAMKGLLVVWQNRSVRDLLQWMCEYNQINPADPVYFYGFDHQQAWQDAPKLKELLVQFGLPKDSNRIARLDQCAGASARSAKSFFASGGMPVPEEAHRTCLRALDRVSRFVSRNEERLLQLALATPADIQWAKIHIVGLRAWQEEMFYYESDSARSFEARDAGMAYIAQEIRSLRFPKARTALWAHNAHVANGGEFVPGALDMGFFLRQDLGRKYEAVALVARDAEVDWPGVGCGLARSSAATSVEASLSRLREPYLLVDLNFPGAEEPLLAADRELELNGHRFSPRKEFRALVYLESAGKMQPIGREPCD